MLKADPQTIQDLNITCQMLSHVAGQFQVDVRNVHRFGLKWLSDKMKCWYGKSEKHLRIFIDRIFYYGEDPEYDAGMVTGGEDIEQILKRQYDMAYGVLDFMTAARKRAWDIKADYTTDDYEHAIGDLEKITIKIDQQLNLIKMMGVPAYVSARLEDN